jgi:hypothetical protein
MGFDEVVRSADDIHVSDTQAYRQFGNAVVPAVVRAIGDRILDVMYERWRSRGNGCLLKKKGKQSPRRTKVVAS